jgi:hypothetical protein
VVVACGTGGLGVGWWVWWLKRPRGRSLMAAALEARASSDAVGSGKGTGNLQATCKATN